MPRSFERMRSSRDVMTQSTSLTGEVDLSLSLSCAHHLSVNSSRLASSFLSKQGIIAKCQIRDGWMPSDLLRMDLSNVPVNACGDLSFER